MKNIISTAIVIASFSTNALALDCSFIGGKIESVAHAANAKPALNVMSATNVKINTLIQLCSAKGVAIPEQLIENLDLTTIAPKGSDCDPSTVGGQSERAAGYVSNQLGHVKSAAEAVDRNVETLTSVLLVCISN